jgi:hypothetical protein
MPSADDAMCSKWHGGGQTLSHSYQPPHHRYVTEKTIGKIVLDGGSAAAPHVRIDVSNSKELKCALGSPVDAY